MKYLFTLAVFVFGLLSVEAQITSQETEVYNAMYGMQKREVIESFVKVPEAQQAAFWDVYNEYEAERSALVKRRFELINEYASLLENMNDEQADLVANEALKLNADVEKLMSKYYKKMKKVTSPMIAANFLQIENYLRMVLRMSINESIPFISDQN